MDDFIINKAEAIEKYWERIKEIYFINRDRFSSDNTRQDAVIMNIQRATWAAVKMAQHVVRKKNLGISKTVHDVFLLLMNANIISKNVVERFLILTDFRKIIGDDYLSVDVPLIQSIIENDLNTFLEFNKAVLTLK